jgi:hypothetical protein
MHFSLKNKYCASKYVLLLLISSLFSSCIFDEKFYDLFLDIVVLDTVMCTDVSFFRKDDIQNQTQIPQAEIKINNILMQYNSISGYYKDYNYRPNPGDIIDFSFSYDGITFSKAITMHGSMIFDVGMENKIFDSTKNIAISWSPITPPPTKIVLNVNKAYTRNNLIYATDITGTNTNIIVPPYTLLSSQPSVPLDYFLVTELNSSAYESIDLFINMLSSHELHIKTQ